MDKKKTDGSPRDQTVLKAIRMKSGLVQEIERMAERENRNFSNMVNTILTNAIKVSQLECP